MKKKKRYSLGTGPSGIVDNYMESPSEALSQSSIDVAKTMEGGNTFGTDFLNAFSGVLLAGADPISKIGMKTGIFGKEEKPKMKFGGTVEVEGKEVAETPGGSLLDFFGPTHEKGGMDVDLPKGTNIFSDAVRVEGKTMAERKKARNKKLKEMKGLLEGNKSDSALRKTYQRTIDNLTNEEDSDLAVQQMMDMLFGDKNKKEAKFGLGLLSNIFDPDDEEEFPENDSTESSTDSDKENKFNDVNIESSDNASADVGVSTGSSSVDNTSEPKSTSDNTTKEPAQESSQESIEEPSTEGDEEGNGFESLLKKVPIGDAVGLIGNIVSAFSPERNTLKNRATDTPNINAYKDFGEDALEANTKAQELVKGIKSNTDRDIDISRRSLVKRGRNSARGVNSQRAMDVAAEFQSNRAKRQAQNDLSRSLMRLFSEKSRLENQQDSVVMRGEQQRDIADRQDKDNFYTQLAQDRATKGTGLQETGRDLNAGTKREIVKTLLNQLSAYGITLDDDNKLTTDKE